MAASMEKFPFAAIVPVSAEKGRQLGDLLGEIKKFLPESVPFFDPDTYTDRSPRFLAGRDDPARRPSACSATSFRTALP